MHFIWAIVDSFQLASCGNSSNLLDKLVKEFTVKYLNRNFDKEVDQPTQISVASWCHKASSVIIIIDYPTGCSWLRHSSWWNGSAETWPCFS